MMPRVRVVLAMQGRRFRDLCDAIQLERNHLRRVLIGERPLKGHIADALERELGTDAWRYVQEGGMING